jgi:outer membrane murein-binding lipoprotein Lpp
MSQNPPAVLEFAPKNRAVHESDQIEMSANTIIATLREAGNISNENVDRAMRIAHKLSLQLRAAEDRITELQADLEAARGRAGRAERWLETIEKEVRDKLIVSVEADHRKVAALQ